VPEPWAYRQQHISEDGSYDLDDPFLAQAKWSNDEQRSPSSRRLERKQPPSPPSLPFLPRLVRLCSGTANENEGGGPALGSALGSLEGSFRWKVRNEEGIAARISFVQILCALMRGLLSRRDGELGRADAAFPIRRPGIDRRLRWSRRCSSAALDGIFFVFFSCRRLQSLACLLVHDVSWGGMGATDVNDTLSRVPLQCLWRAMRAHGERLRTRSRLFTVSRLLQREAHSRAGGNRSNQK